MKLDANDTYRLDNHCPGPCMRPRAWAGVE